MSFRAALMTVFVLGCLQSACRADSSWNEKKGEHFIVYFQTDGAFAESALASADHIYEEEVRYFGSMPQDFWLWDNRCKIYLYDSQESYLVATHQPDWSNGYADVHERAIVSYEGAADFLEMVLPHEMAHLIFREFVEAGNTKVPRWLDEGFAISQEKKTRSYLDQAIKRAVSSDKAIEIGELNRFSALHMTPADQAKLFYAEAQSLTHFLLEGRDGSHFLNFCRSLRDGADMEEALRKGYPGEFSTVVTFEKKWKKFVMAS